MDYREFYHIYDDDERNNDHDMQADVSEHSQSHLDSSIGSPEYTIHDSSQDYDSEDST